MKIFRIFIILLLITNFSDLKSDEKSDILKNKILKNIRCLICQGQSVYDSESEFASSVKLIVDRGTLSFKFSNIIKSSSFFDIEEHIYHYYDIIIATIFEKITEETSKTKLLELLEEMHKIDPLKTNL